MENQIKRGEIYYYDFGECPGSVQSGRRPVLILESEEANRKSPTVIAAAITSVMKKQYLPSHVVLPLEVGLKNESMVLLEQIRTINKSDLEEKVGFLDDEKTWRYINRSIKKLFGLWIKNPDRSGDIRCLCSRCLQDYKTNSSFIVKRLDPFQSEKSCCDKCENLGYDYIVFDKKAYR